MPAVKVPGPLIFGLVVPGARIPPLTRLKPALAPTVTLPDAIRSELIDVVGAEFKRAAAERPTDAELARAKAQLKAGLLMGLESSSARAEQMARQLLLFDRLIDTPELVERIENVSPDAVRALAAKLVTGTQPSVAIVGAGGKGDNYARLAEGLGAG